MADESSARQAHWQRVSEIFHVLLESPQRDRTMHLMKLCGGDPALRADVQRMLEAENAIDSAFLNPPSARANRAEAGQAPQPAQSSYSRLGPHSEIGPYTLREQIGEGGFGTVFLAEQQRPVRRRVALKVIKPGMDTRQVIARFQAERQALALMDHPNIARVLDGGETSSGHPYFVMELVKGVPITEYCDQCNLTTRQRLELFIPVCQAVQHAHQKGIIHRDLKPSNVLVAMQDGQPAPKVIDFGVAKAINQRLTEQTIHTQYAQMVGTPLYMSPEQAEMSPLEVDTRSDVYSLGAMLYELLVGTPPFEAARMKQVGFDELRRIIREEEPPAPSSRLSTLGAQASTIAHHRRTDLRRLRLAVQGDLDWVVMKALDKDRTRRYGSAGELADDIRRYLDSQPVEARPPSFFYKTSKFVRRNRVSVATILVISLAALIGGGISTALIVQQRNTARANAQQADEHRQRAEDNLRGARAVVDRMLTRLGHDLWNVPYMTEIRRDLFEEALAFYQGIMAQGYEDPDIRRAAGLAYLNVAWIHSTMGDRRKEEEYSRPAIALFEQLVQEQPDNEDDLFWLAEGYRTLSSSVFFRDFNQEAWDLCFHELDIRLILVDRFPGNPRHHQYLAWTYTGAGNLLQRLPGRRLEAENYFLLALGVWDQFRIRFPDGPRVDDNGDEGHTLQWLANLYIYRLHRYEEAEDCLRRSIELRRRQIEREGENSNRVYELASTQRHLGVALTRLGSLVEAENLMRLAIDTFKQLHELFPAHVEYHYRLRFCYNDWVVVLQKLRRFEEARQAAQLAADLPLCSDSRDVLSLAESQYVLGCLNHDEGQLEEANALFRKSLALLEPVFAQHPEHPWAAEILRWFLVTCPVEEFRDLPRSLSLCQAALELDDEYALNWRDLGCVLYAMGRFDDASEALQKSVALGNSRDANCYYLLAMSAWQLGEFGEAREWFEQAQENHFVGFYIDHYVDLAAYYQR